MPNTCLYPPWDRTRRSVWDVRQTKSCCSRVIEVWTRIAPPSQGSAIPAEPGRKNPADSSWKIRLGRDWWKNIENLTNVIQRKTPPKTRLLRDLWWALKFWWKLANRTSADKNSIRHKLHLSQISQMTNFLSSLDNLEPNDSTNLRKNKNIHHFLGQWISSLNSGNAKMSRRCQGMFFSLRTIPISISEP